MKDSNRDTKFRRHLSEKGERHHADRHDERTTRGLHDTDHSEYHRAERKRVHNDSRVSEKKSQRDFRREKEYYHSVRKGNSSRHISPLLARREGIHRNSPVELVVKGCRHTDSSSSDSESSHSDHRNDGSRQRRRHREESYEELSRKKRQLESELSALLEEEEAENKRARDQRKKPSKSHPSHEERADFRIDRPIKRERVSDDESGRYGRRNSPGRSNEKAEWGKKKNSDSKTVVKEKEKPNFAVSGKLAEDTNTYNGVVIKYNEPPEARKPRRRWRLYPFKGDNALDFIPIHRQSAYLLGRSRLIADIPIDHPSCSKQHAVLQYRLVNYERDDGTIGRNLRPYIIDLDSANGTYVNNNRVEPRRYVELLEKDVIKFGFSTREYVILHDQSKDQALLDDDVGEEEDQNV